MEQLIFFAVIIFFSIIESISRKRKAERAREASGGVSPELTDELERQFAWAHEPNDDVPTFDSDPSYDEGPSYDSGPSSDGGPAYDDRMGPSVGRTQASSEAPAGPGGFFQGLTDIAAKLEEARVLYEREQQEAEDRAVRGEERALAQTLTLARQSPQISQTAPLAVPSSRTAPEHFVHGAHSEYGTDPSERAPSEQGRINPLGETLSAEARAVRLQLMSHSESSLRQALILREVLGPPLALRDD